MLLSEFLNVMYNYSGKDMKKAAFFISLFDIWTNDSDASSNPFQNLNADTIERYFNKTEISKKNARMALGKADKHSFAKYITDLSDTNQLAIEEAFKRSIPDFNQDENLGYACADLLHNILSDICQKEQTSPASDTSSHVVLTDETVQPANAYSFNLLYQSFGFTELTPSLLINNKSVIDLNENPTKLSLASTSNVIYKFKTVYKFDYEYAPDLSRKITLTFDINNISLIGFTSTQKWSSDSMVDVLVYDENRVCTAWFYISSTQREKICVKFLMIGDIYE